MKSAESLFDKHRTLPHLGFHRPILHKEIAMRSTKFLMIVFAICLPIQVAAKESVDYRQSKECAGALSIMTALGRQDDTAPIYKYFDDLLMFHSYLLEYYASRDVGGVTLGVAVSEGVVLVDIAASRDASSLAASVKHCISWINAVQVNFSEQGPNTPVSQVMANAPKPSMTYDYPFEQWSPMVPIVELAYELWQSSGLREYHQCMAQSDGASSNRINCMSRMGQ